MEALSKEYGDALRVGFQTHLDRFDRVPFSSSEELRPAAVAVTLLPGDDGSPAFVLTRRAARLNSHTGQWALPGGRLEAGETIEEAALRELEEEVGVAPGADSVLGLLDDYPTRSGYNITPVVVWCAADSVLKPDPGEVAEVYRVALGELEHPEVPRLRTIPESDRPVISLPLIGHDIHAPTAAVLYQFREVVVHGRATRVAHFEQPVFAWR
jgi:8-oxo-dGTP pyrophosphatase MutT (NUDIX family)